MQTVLTRMVLTNAHVKWDTLAMDTHVQVILKITLLIFLNKTNFCKSSHNLEQRYPCTHLCTELPCSTSCLFQNSQVDKFNYLC